jgi:S1-C subfamily serine protease
VLDKKSGGEANHSRRRYAIATGVCVGDGLIVTAMRPRKRCEFRVTVPGGQRADAKACVIDEHTSLILLETQLAAGAKALDKTADNPAVSPVKISSRPATLGAKLLAASAWGTEPPSVSQGVLSSADRFLPSSLLPPLLQCDVHTTETSRGAGVVNSAGELVGIVVAVENDHRTDWTYLIGAEHVARLVAARKPGELVDLPRRVAHAGMDLRQAAGSDKLVVQNVSAGGPAEKAGIRPGDEVRSLDGQAIHSAFAAAKTIARCSPGDKIECVVRRGNIDVTASLLLEKATDEPTIFYAGGAERKLAIERKGAVAGSKNPGGNAPIAGSQVENRPRSELSKSSEAEENEAQTPTIRKPGEVDKLDALRARLIEQEALIKQLERELAELRRERDRLRGESNESIVPGPSGEAPPK